MLPDKVGRMILDGTEYVSEHRHRDGFEVTGLWRDGFLEQWLNAGLQQCDLAKPRDGKPVTLPDP